MTFLKAKPVLEDKFWITTDGLREFNDFRKGVMDIFGLIDLDNDKTLYK